METASAVCLGAGACTSDDSVPADFLDLSMWKLQVPHSSDGSFTEGYAASIKQPALDTYEYPDLFFLDTLEDGTQAVVMRTPV